MAFSIGKLRIRKDVVEGIVNKDKFCFLFLITIVEKDTQEKNPRKL